MLSFICNPCQHAADSTCLTPETKKAMHDECKGGTWCDCQHRTDRRKGASK